MKGPLSADRLFFISALVFAASFVIYTAVGYIWPVPMLPDAVAAQLPPDPLANPLSFGGLLSQLSWILSIAGLVTFVLGMLARKS